MKFQIPHYAIVYSVDNDVVGQKVCCITLKMHMVTISSHKKFYHPMDMRSYKFVHPFQFLYLRACFGGKHCKTINPFQYENAAYLYCPKGKFPKFTMQLINLIKL